MFLIPGYLELDRNMDSAQKNGQLFPEFHTPTALIKKRNTWISNDLQHF